MTLICKWDIVKFPPCLPALFRAFAVLNLFEFTSERKRMSVIVEEVERKRLFMFTKGADTAIFSKLTTPGETCGGRLEKFASSGLRTMCFASKRIRRQDYEAWKVTWDEASTTIANRKENIARAMDQERQSFT